MRYDPVKEKIGRVVGTSVFLRVLFYRLLDILLLRTWHVRKAVRLFAEENSRSEVSVLDAGSGFGQYVWRIHRMNPAWKITGVDLKEEQRSDCTSFFRKAGAGDNVSFETADLTSFSRPETYNLILSDGTY
jgi:cyclopropane fatty-acyl-phospholipid synthase-like methyltransferase